MPELLSWVREVNLSGRLFPAPDSVLLQGALDALVRQGAVAPINATDTSLGGYVALADSVARNGAERQA